MSAFVIAHSTVNDPELFQTYAQGVAPTLESFGGEVLLKGKLAKLFVGAHPHTAVGILRFPDLDAAVDWYESAAYQALIETRDRAAEMTLMVYEQPAA